jgi:adenylate kinase
VSKSEIAAIEGVNKSTITRSIDKGLKNIRINLKIFSKG